MLRKLLLLIVFVVAVFFVPSAHSQENATITGTVTDPTGAAVPKVSISLISQSTGQVRQTISNADGIYSFVNVGVGHFTLTAPPRDFKNSPGLTSS
jgi:hypothetical protein